MGNLVHEAGRFHQTGHHALTDPSQGQANYRDSELDTIHHFVEPLVQALDDAGADTYGFDQLLDAGVARAYQREFSCREEAVGCHQEQDQKHPEQHKGNH